MTATVAHFVKNKDIKKEGYLLRKAKKKNKLTRDWFSLLDRELYYYKSKKEAQHKNLYILVGVYITKEEPEMFQDELKLYPFTLVFPHKSRTFYCIKESECNGWIKVLKEAVGYSDFFDFYELGEIIGRGKFSVVKNAIHLKTKKKVAVKILPKTEKTKKDLELQKREIEILKICQHPNIIRLLDIFENESTLFLVIEYLPGGDMFDFLQERGFDIKESQAKNYVKKIATALTYLHSFGIAYRDLKPENILMSSSDDTADIKISDFGLSKIIAPNERSDEPFGTISYAAPEVLLGNSYDKSVDLWSLGVVTYLLVSGTLPFDDDNEDLIIERAIKEEPDYKSPWIAKVSKNCKDFIKKLLSKGDLSFSLPLTVFLFRTINC
jgi:calcium/calmodulin-dependent protein kinase I